MRHLKLLALAVVLALASVTASAVTVGPDCETCQGGIYTLTSSPVSSNGDEVTYNFTLETDTSGYNGGGAFINSVSIKPGSSLESGILLFPASGWSTELGGLNAEGCSGAGSGFICSQSTGLGTAVGGTNTWTWQITLLATSLFGELEDASLKIRYVDGLGEKVGALVSTNFNGETIPEVPDPATAGLAGLGLSIIAIIGWRRGWHKKRPA